jgi:hypothetical protein
MVAGEVMKLILVFSDKPPIEVDKVERIKLRHGKDEYEVRPSNDSLLVRIEAHGDGLAMDLAVFPIGGNGIRVKGGLR